MALPTQGKVHSCPTFTAVNLATLSRVINLATLSWVVNLATLSWIINLVTLSWVLGLAEMEGDSNIQIQATSNTRMCLRALTDRKDFIVKCDKIKTLGLDGQKNTRMEDHKDLLEGKLRKTSEWEISKYLNNLY